MRKGIAITTILLLLVGSLVTGVTVYYTYRSMSGSPLSEYECRGMMVSWCIGCSNQGYEGENEVDPALGECASIYWGIDSELKCKDAEDDCSAFLPGGWGGGDGATDACEDVSGGRCVDRDTCLGFGEGWTCVIDNPTDCDPGQCCCADLTP